MTHIQHSDRAEGKDYATVVLHISHQWSFVVSWFKQLKLPGYLSCNWVCGREKKHTERGKKNSNRNCVPFFSSASNQLKDSQETMEEKEKRNPLMFGWVGYSARVQHRSGCVLYGRRQLFLLFFL